MNKYEEVRILGQGSYGKAILCKRKRDGRLFVIKEIRMANLPPQDREDALNEANVLSSLSHPYIVKYEESFQERGCFFIVMEYADGGDLAAKIRDKRGFFTESEVLQTFIQLALAIKFIHDRKILHRDLKAQNIFLMKDGTVKLGDFGIARVLENTFQLCHTRIGTPYYLSPEICEGKTYNSKTDIWSLGCILYELCTLKHAFNAQNMSALVVQIIRGKYEPIPSCYSNDLKILISNMLTSDQKTRPSINGVLNTPILKTRLHLFLADANQPRKPMINPVIIKASISEINGIQLERQVLQDKYLKQKESEKAREIRQRQLDELIKRKKEEQRKRRKQEEEELMRLRQEAIAKRAALIENNNAEYLDTIGKIRHNEFKEARQIAVLNKQKAKGGLDFENESVVEDSFLKGMISDMPEWAAEADSKQQPDNNYNFNHNNQHSKIGILSENKKSNRRFPGILNSGDPKNEDSPTINNSPLTSSKSFEDSASLSMTSQAERRRKLMEQRAAIHDNWKTLKSLEMQTQELKPSGSPQTNEQQRTKIILPSLQTPKVENKIKFVPIENGDNKEICNINEDTTDFLQSSNTTNRSRLKELGIDPSLAKNEKDRKILIDLDLELSGKTSPRIRSRSRSDFSSQSLIESLLPENEPMPDLDNSKPRPLIQMGVVEAKSHVSQIHTLISSIKSVLNLPNDADGTTDEFEIPSTRPINHDLINKEVRFPIVSDSDSLMYRAEAMRAFLERELGLEEFIALRHEIESQNNGIEVISKYPSVLPGIVVILQQLLVLEHLIED